MIKLSLSGEGLRAAKYIGGNAALGAGIGAFQQHRLQKRKALEDNGTPKGMKPSKLRGAVVGGLSGALSGYWMQRGPHFHGDQLKRAKEVWKAKGMPFRDVDHAVGTAAGSAIGGALGYQHGKKHEKEKSPKKRRDRWASAAGGALLGGQLGHIAGGASRFFRVLKHQDRVNAAGTGAASGAFRATSSGPPAWAKHAKTKKEAKRAYYAQAQKHHEDHGGSKEKMQQIIEEWKEFQNSKHFEKLAGMLDGLFSELYEITTG